MHARPHAPPSPSPCHLWITRLVRSLSCPHMFPIAPIRRLLVLSGGCVELRNSRIRE